VPIKVETEIKNTLNNAQEVNMLKRDHWPQSRAHLPTLRNQTWILMA